MLAKGRQGEDRRPILVVEPAGVGLAGLQAAEPVGLGDPEVDLGQIAVGDADAGEGRCPGPLGGERQLLGLDLRDKVRALRSAVALRVGGRGLGREFPCRHEVAPAVDQARQVKGRKRCGLMIAGPLDEGPEGGFLAVAKPLAHSRITSPEDPVEIGREQG
jgi:hypothetical protein